MLIGGKVVQKQPQNTTRHFADTKNQLSKKSRYVQTMHKSEIDPSFKSGYGL